MTRLPLIRGSDLDAPLALRAGLPISRRQYLADVQALAARLPDQGQMLNTTADRYRFAVGLGAAMLRGHGNLLPSNHTPDTVARLTRRFPQAYGLGDDPARAIGLPMVQAPREHAPLGEGIEVPAIDAAMIAAQVLTSGSTGEPIPHAKRWGRLVSTMQSGALPLARQMGRASLDGVSLVATVPPQHMYGFESSVLIAMLAGAAFETGRPFYPADIAAALARVPRPRMLVTTPFHLKALIDARLDLPVVDLTLCATAPLSPQLAARAEAALAAPLVEIYGCTEAGQVATRRTTAGPEWTTYDGLRIAGDGERAVISGGHVSEPTPLADVLEVVDPRHFRLLGRSNDLVNIAGKRSSLGHLDYHLNSIDGVVDGAFLMPADARDDDAGVVRLAAFVVAPGIAQEAILAALRQRIDPAFLPRPLVAVEALPRESTGKLPAARFAAWAATRLDTQEETTGRSRVSSSPSGGLTRSGRSGGAVNGAPAPVAHEFALDIAVDHPAFAGHFVGQPLLPGVLLLAEIIEAALAVPRLAALIGAAPRIGAVKFLSPVRPGAELRLKLSEQRPGLRFDVRCGDHLAATGHFETR